VIRAFNADVPFDRFLMEHIAGDLLAKPRRNPKDGTNESLLATAYWWLGEASHSPVDSRADHANRIDNQIDVFGKSVLGLTLACARCHDHKFDPIATKDYYSLFSVLASSRLNRADLADAAPTEKLLEELKQVRAELANVLSPAVVEKQGADAPRSPGDWRAKAAEFLRQLPADRYPHVAEHIAYHIESGTYDEGDFEFGLDLIIDGLERLLGQRRGGGRDAESLDPVRRGGGGHGGGGHDGGGQGGGGADPGRGVDGRDADGRGADGRRGRTR
jgi:hypothetical protein